MKGTAWSRPDDVFGSALVVNGLSHSHRDYLAAGGYGFIVGDGKLNYAWENIVETYYSFQVFKGIFASLDYQFINHPGYNRDRGPAHVFGIRAHAGF